MILTEICSPAISFSIQPDKEFALKFSYRLPIVRLYNLIVRMTKELKLAHVQTKARILDSAIELFSKNGFDGVSLRDISTKSKTNLNSIRHHFGNKQDLLFHVFEKFDKSVFDAPLRILEGGSSDKVEFRTKLGLFLNEVMTQMLAQKEIFKIIFHEGHRSKRKFHYVPQQEAIIAFLKQGQRKGVVSKDIHPELISGVFMDRLIPQVLFAQRLKKTFGTDIEDQKFRKKWIDSTLNLYLHGLYVREN